MRKRISPSFAIAATALFISLGGTGWAAANHYLITRASQIKPSVRAELRGERGPQGLQGLQGPAGPLGPRGIEGPQGAPGTVSQGTDYASQDSAALSPSSPTATLTLRCNPGDQVVSGGFDGNAEIVTESELVGAPVVNGVTLGLGWEVTAHLDPGATSGLVIVRVTCSH